MDSASTARTAGSSISGERIASQARKYISKPAVRIGGVELKRMLLIKIAYCVVEVPLRYPPISGPPVTAGAALHGERIESHAVCYSRLGKTKGSSTHDIQTCKLIGNAYCVLAVPLMGLSAPKK